MENYMILAAILKKCQAPTEKIDLAPSPNQIPNSDGIWPAKIPLFKK
jgi:hypothetical protein